jgi:hypothetical protein
MRTPPQRRWAEGPADEVRQRVERTVYVEDFKGDSTDTQLDRVVPAPIFIGRDAEIAELNPDLLT